MYARITAVQATDDYKLFLTFDNIERRLFDIKPYLTVGRFAELRDIEVFKQVGSNSKFDTESRLQPGLSTILTPTTLG